MIAHEPSLPHAERSGPGYDGAELSGKRVGMVGFGHLAGA
jgi:phosphoglycerate dehydrogenase-like enzyme